MARILVVEDNYELGRFLKTTIQALDSSFQITVVPSAEEAYLDIIRHQIDILVTDLKLPGKSGVELARQVVNKSPQTAIIVVTGVENQDWLAELRDLGVKQIFRKPLNIEHLTKVIHSILKKDEEPAEVSEEIEIQPVDESEGSKTRLSLSVDMVSQLLRQLVVSCGATSAYLYNRDRQPVYQTSRLERDPELKQLVEGLIRLSNFNEDPELLVPDGVLSHIHHFQTKTEKFFLMPVQRYMIILRFAYGEESINLQKVYDDLIWMQMTISEKIDHPETIDQVPVELQEETPSVQEDEDTEAELEKMMKIFENTSDVIEKSEVQEYWDEKEDIQSGYGSNSPGILSFEEALKLGLIPEDEIDPSDTFKDSD